MTLCVDSHAQSTGLMPFHFHRSKA